jgi:hypothetical protein
MVTGLILDRTLAMHQHEHVQLVLALTEGVEVVLWGQNIPVPPLTHYVVEKNDFHFVRLAPGAKAYTFHLGEGQCSPQ